MTNYYFESWKLQVNSIFFPILLHVKADPSFFSPPLCPGQRISVAPRAQDDFLPSRPAGQPTSSFQMGEQNRKRSNRCPVGPQLPAPEPSRPAPYPQDQNPEPGPQAPPGRLLPAPRRDSHHVIALHFQRLSIHATFCVNIRDDAIMAVKLIETTESRLGINSIFSILKLLVYVRVHAP